MLYNTKTDAKLSFYLKLQKIFSLFLPKNVNLLYKPLSSKFIKNTSPLPY